MNDKRPVIVVLGIMMIIGLAFPAWLISVVWVRPVFLFAVGAVVAVTRTLAFQGGYTEQRWLKTATLFSCIIFFGAMGAWLFLEQATGLSGWVFIAAGLPFGGLWVYLDKKCGGGGLRSFIH